MYLIGLTGGIASGKSTVARRLAEHGAHVIDADQLARDAVAVGSAGLRKVVAQFGQQLLGPDGSLNRSALGELVFADPGARARLEAIVHPAVQALYEQRLAEVVAREPDAVVVYDIPLLVESNSSHPYDLVVTTQAGADRQLERMRSERGYEPAVAAQRLAAQATDEQRAERADVVIDTSGSLAHTMALVDELWASVSGRT